MQWDAYRSSNNFGFLTALNLRVQAVARDQWNQMRYPRYYSHRRVHAQVIGARSSCGAIGADAQPN
jgi:hypothetical protein